MACEIPMYIKNSPHIRMLRARLAAEGEARRRERFHTCVMKGMSQEQIDKALDKFDDEWLDHEDEVINAECEEMMAMADFAGERPKKGDEKFSKGREKKRRKSEKACLETH